MLAAVFKRTLSLLIPSALIFFVIQYHETGRVTIFGIAGYVFAFLVTGMALDRLNVWWGQRFGTRKGSNIVQALFWLAAAVCMYLFFRHFDRA
ncbi:hypothetical protein [Paraburkholderia phenazinium]|jgi:hypothetical protein|uniref:Uncharacterized protein n=1 Tax=Paraburkholderia phenazinium TaxID=60549 RepID=A0A1G8GHZ1_9BURK|nr:hypothetical protein [Paraburkholderia phenazinium]SDH94025.1 hypothetical protein SAMN05216466_11515 [Paraburkholderia phenazinium]